MSLEVDGVWKAGAWAPTVWVLGVWHEGGIVVEGEEEIPGVLHKSSQPHDLSPLIKWLKKEGPLASKSDREISDKVEQIVEVGLVPNKETLKSLQQNQILTLIYILLALD